MTTVPTLTPGRRLRSQTCATEVIVVRPGSGSVELTCGGLPMVDFDVPKDAVAEPVSDLCGGSAIGKRYTAEADPTMEVLVTKPGRGSLADGTVPLVVRAPKNLPASD